jgi:hypothetical protein
MHFGTDDNIPDQIEETDADRVIVRTANETFIAAEQILAGVNE